MFCIEVHNAWLRIKKIGMILVSLTLFVNTFLSHKINTVLVVIEYKVDLFESMCLLRV